MSGYVAGAVWNTVMPDRTMKVVLASLGDNASDDGCAWPSVETIAERTMYSRRSVIAALAQLEEQEWISKEQHPEFHRRHAYRINFAKLTFARPKGAYGQPPRGSKSQVQPLHPSDDSLRCNPRQSQVQPLHPSDEVSAAIHDRLRCNPRQSQVQSSASLIGRTVNEPSSEQETPTEFLLSSPNVGLTSAPFEPVIVFPLLRERFHAVTSDELGMWQRAYPAVDVRAELRRILPWLHANPDKQSRSLKGSRQRIVKWLGREQDRGGRSAANQRDQQTRYGASNRGQQRTDGNVAAGRAALAALGVPACVPG